MKQVKCLYCSFFCSKYSKARAGKQRWHGKRCQSVFVNPIWINSYLVEKNYHPQILLVFGISHQHVLSYNPFLIIA